MCSLRSPLFNCSSGMNLVKPSVTARTNRNVREGKLICRLLGWLPLALELAGAFLGEWPEISLADYRTRLQDEGCLPTLDTEVPNLTLVNFQPIHDAAVAATLKTQWNALKQADETARLLLRVAGQFAEAASISTYTLGLFAGVAHTDKPAVPSPLRRALKRLHDVRLVEELLEHRVRLHPLVREFARGPDVQRRHTGVSPRLCPPNRQVIRGAHDSRGNPPGRGPRRAPSRACDGPGVCLAAR